jgi:hypothetical protein
VTFLPIAARELRTACRKRSTFWLRVTAALVGLIIGCGCLLLGSLGGGFGARGAGTALFAMLTWLALAASLSAGLFFTSDCLSEEKREGTLGFLFLTDLRGDDVVAGKLLATSLRGMFALLAIFPILAITLLMGGVTGEHFWKTALALVSALLFSLAAGVFVSSISHASQKAMGAAFFLIFAFVAGGPIADGIYGAYHGHIFVPRLSLASPGYLFTLAGAWGRNSYWLTFLVTQTIALILFGLASVLIPRTWQQKAGKATIATRAVSYSWRYGGPERRLRIRRKLLSRDAMLWLTCRERWQPLGIWLIAILAAAGFITALVELPVEAWMVWQFLGPLCIFPLYVWAASQSSRFFVEARRSGLTELLLAAPLSEGQIVRSHWRGLRRMFAWPILILLCLNLVGGGLSYQSWRGIFSQATAARAAAAANQNPNAAKNTPAPSAIQVILEHTPQLVMTIVSATAIGLKGAANLLAICWFGMWMGLTSRTANLAILKTLVFVQIIPAMIIQFGSAIAISLLLMPFMAFSANSSRSGWYMALWPVISVLAAALLSIGKDIGFIVWARRKLYHSSRQQAVCNFSQKPAMAPRAPALSLTPPVIPAAQ